MRSFLTVLVALLSSSQRLMVVVVAQEICQQSNFGEFSLDNSKCFSLSNSPTASYRFSCQTPGSRIAYTASDYSVLPVTSGGGNAETGQLSLWTVEVPSNNTLTLAGCNLPGSCLARGFLDCSCENLETGGACETTDIAPPLGPTPGPTTQYPSCPADKTTDTKFCKWLLENQVPIPDPGCDCYNFCRGEFQSCCNLFSGSCGNTECIPEPSDAQPGTLNSYVWGCHVGHLEDPNQETPPNPPEPWNPFRTRTTTIEEEEEDPTSAAGAVAVAVSVSVLAARWATTALALGVAIMVTMA